MPSVGGAGVTAGAVALQRNSAVAEYMSPRLGQWVGRVKKKYNQFTHRLDMGAEHWQMHRRALALKQEQRVINGVGVVLCKLLAVKEISPVPHRVYKIVEMADLPEHSGFMVSDLTVLNVCRLRKLSSNCPGVKPLVRQELQCRECEALRRLNENQLRSIRRTECYGSYDKKRGLIHLWKTRLPWWSHWWRPVCALLRSPCPLGGLRVGAGIGGAKLKRLVEAVLLATPLL